jgi:hypothetical protein
MVLGRPAWNGMRMGREREAYRGRRPGGRLLAAPKPKPHAFANRVQIYFCYIGEMLHLVTLVTGHVAAVQTTRTLMEHWT